MLKNFLYFLAFILLLSSCYFAYDWHTSEPENKETFPALLSIIGSLIMIIIGWLNDQKTSKKDNVSVNNVEAGALVDVDPKDNTNYTLDKITGAKTRVIIRGKNTPKNDPETDNPS
jgi:hypothetical protein